MHEKKQIPQIVFAIIMLVIGIAYAMCVGSYLGAKEAAAKAEAQAAAEQAAQEAFGDVTLIPGVYTSTRQGFGGEVTVEMEIAETGITRVDITGDAETPTLGGVAIKELSDKIFRLQTPNVDAVSGATVTSTAIIESAKEIMAQAGCDVDAMKSESALVENVEKTEEVLDCDVVIVGAGGAGMTAAIKAVQAGKDVIIIDKMPYVGGNTTKASGGMNSASTQKQLEAAEKEEDEAVKAAILDSTVENYIADTMKGGHDINDIELVTTMAEKSAEAIEWLESIGAPLPKIAATGGTVHYYLHEPEDGSAVGEFLVESYTKTLEDLGLEVMLNTKATDLIVEDGKVAGIKAEGKDKDYTINAGAVIITSGGFGANFDMLASFDPSLANAVTTNTPAATGDGIVMAEAVGADTVDMEQIQLHPTVFQANGLLVSERLRSNGAILVNKEGKRFINDLATRDTVSQAELQQPDALAFIVYDSKYAEEKLYQKYVTNGLTQTADTLEELGEMLGFDAAGVENFVATVEAWNKVCAGEQEDEFGRNNGLVSLDQAPFTAIMIAPGIHHTMGGLKIDTEAEVLDKDGNAIPGLFAAGEVTGGVHGGNRIGGNAVADIVVFGQIAADSAVAYMEQ